VADRIRRGDDGPSSEQLRSEERVVSVLFADLVSFTTFSESRPPTEVLSMLNTFWAAVVPVIDRAGGVIEQFAGDGVMAIFNARGDQPDHAVRAARAALAIVDVARPLAAAHEGWPIFRVGVNTGPAVVGDIGAEARRSFAAIGDSTNTAARLMAAGDPGQVVVGRATWEALGPTAVGISLGPIMVKGKTEAVEAWRLESV
jgi:class 3 adenylate cyclase